MAVKFLNKKADKDERLTLRISAKDKFAMELLAKKEGMTISAFFIQVIQKPLKEGLTTTKKSKRVYIPDVAYDPLLPDRTVKLALVAPELLTAHETVIWKVIQENTKYFSDNSPNYKDIRDEWDSIETKANELIKQYSK